MSSSTDTKILENPKTLYDEDLQMWIEQTIHQLKNREFEALDLENLIEELIDLGKSEKTGFVSNLKVLLAHLLKLKVQNDAPDIMKSSWFDSVYEHRERVKDTLADNPSFQNFLAEAMEKAYPKARNWAIQESKFAKRNVRLPKEDEYPTTCPFTIEQILDENFYGS